MRKTAGVSPSGSPESPAGSASGQGCCKLEWTDPQHLVAKTMNPCTVKTYNFKTNYAKSKGLKNNDKIKRS